MDILVLFSIRKKELAGAVSDEAKKLFAKPKEKPEIATAIYLRRIQPLGDRAL